MKTMKMQFKYMMMAAAAAVLSMGAVSCDEASIDDIEGIYEAPTVLSVKGATMADKTKEGNLRTMHMAMTTAEGTTVNLAFVCNQYYLTSNGYTPMAAGAAKNGNLVSELSSINGSNVIEGTLALSQNGDEYTISKSILFTADGKSYKISGAFTSAFEPDDPLAINTVKEVTDNGDGTVAVTFTTGGYTATFDASTYQMVYTGEGNDLKIVFNLPDGKLREGVYSPGTGYVAGWEHENRDYEAWGIVYTEYFGSCWYTIADGALATQIVTAGDVVVTKKGAKYTILLDQGKGGIFAQFEGALPDLDPDGGSGAIPVEMTGVAAVNNYAAMGWTGLIDIQLVNGDVVATTDPTTYATTYTGSGDFLQIEVYSEQGVGTLARGTYEIADDASFGPMKFKVGAVGMYGDGGTFLKKVTDGVMGEAQFITEGSLTIEGEGDATTITLTTGGYEYTYTGNLGL